jgi:hypothetical protein
VGGNYNVWLSGTPQAQLLNAYAGALGGAGKFSQTNTYTAGNYEVINGLKVYAGRATSKATDQTVVNLSSTNYGASYTMGQVDLLVNAAKVDDKSTVNADRKLTGLGANYNLSKTTRAYYRYDKINYNTNSTSGINQTRNAVGLSMSF